MATYKAKKIGRLGEYDPKYGQRYWGEVHDAQMPVTFNLMQQNVEIPDGAILEFEERTIKETGPNSKKPGTEYLFLRKVKVSGQQSLPPVPNDTNRTLELILENTQQILKILDKPKSLGESWRETTATEAEVVDNVVEDIGDGPIDLSDIPF